MNRNTMLACALVMAASACQEMPSSGRAPSGMPAYVPAHALPPVVTVASDGLVGPLWQWLSLQTGAAPAVATVAPERYTLSFQPSGRVNVRADCNRGSASYEVNNAQMSVGAIALTRMMCSAGSQDMAFLRALTQVTGYAIDRGDLVLTQQGGAAMRFRPAQ